MCTYFPVFPLGQSVPRATNNEEAMLTVDGQIDPRSVATGVVDVISGWTVEEHHRALVPALVRRPQVRYLYRRLLDQPDAALVAGVHVRRVAVELDENGHLLHTANNTRRLNSVSSTTDRHR